MGTATAVVVFLWVLGNAVRQVRRQRALGLKFEWDKAFATAGGCILVTLAAIGALIGMMALDQPIPGTILCVLILAGGLTGLIVWVNRRWPRRPGE